MLASRLAAGCAWLSGLGFGLPAVYGAVHLARTGEVWQFMGFPTYGHGRSVPLIVGFAVVCGAEVVVGTLLWRGSGKKLALALLPFEIAYWVGFALPVGPVLGAARTIASFVPSRDARPR